MINHILYRIFRNKKNWDPVSPNYAYEYYKLDLKNGLNKKYFKMLDRESFIYYGNKILDVGAGPGIYTEEFAKLGAILFWQDISNSFFEIAQKKLKSQNYQLTFITEQIEVCMKKIKNFDLIFSRLSFYYAKNDKEFFTDAYNSLNLNGYLLIDCNTYERFTYKAKLIEKLQIFLYHNLNIKVGHPLPTHKMIYKLAKNSGFQIVNNEYDSKNNICILLKKIK